MVAKDHPALSVTAPCRLLSIPRSTFSHAPCGETAENLTLMRRLDEQVLQTPFHGVRQMTWHLRAEGVTVNPKRVWRLMRRMDLMPIFQKPNTSAPAKAHKVWPCLLRGRTIDHPSEVPAWPTGHAPFRYRMICLLTDHGAPT